MKRLIITLLIATVAMSVHAQQQPQKPSKPVTIILPDSSNLTQLQVVLRFSYQYLPKSDAPANQVGVMLPIIEQLYPILVPAKRDSILKVKPPTKE